MDLQPNQKRKQHDHHWGTNMHEEQPSNKETEKGPPSKLKQM